MITYHDLEQFGLGEKEARVYLASLELGPATAAEIAQKAGVKRATTYTEIELLMDMGLMSTYEHNKKTLFSAESPEALKRIIKNQEENLKTAASSLEGILPALLSMHNYAGEKPKVRFFEGKEGLIAIQDEFIKTKDKVIEAISPADEILEIFPDHPKEYSTRRVQKKIFARLLYTSSKGIILAPKDKKMLREAKFIPKEKFPFMSDITIFDNKVAISALKGKLVGVIIENEMIAKTLKSIFYLAWEAADKYQEK